LTGKFPIIINHKIMKSRFLITLMSFALVGCGGSANENLFSKSGDVGDVKHPGSTAFDAATGIYTLTGSGINMWETSDEFFMTWREVTGDFSLSADVAFEGEGVNAHRKLGLIIRDGVTGDAVYADIAVHGDGLTSLQYRPTKGGETLEVAAGGVTGDPIPNNITLERRGNTLTATSMRGSEKGAPASIYIELPETCLVGLFVC
jgi:hypothetical protein